MNYFRETLAPDTVEDLPVDMEGPRASAKELVSECRTDLEENRTGAAALAAELVLQLADRAPPTGADEIVKPSSMPSGASTALVVRMWSRENRFVGMKSRGVNETPGGTLLHKAHRGVASLTMDRESMRLRDSLAVEYSTLVYRGFWFSPEREALQKLVDDVNEPVPGIARLRLFNGGLTLVGRSAPKSLYRADIVTFEDDGGAYDQRDAGGFIRLNALRLRTNASVRDR